jgi:hypothetical protein
MTPLPYHFLVLMLMMALPSGAVLAEEANLVGTLVK